MQKDIQTSKGEQKSDFTSTAEKVGDTAGHKMKQVGHDINAGLKENVGVGVGNYSSGVDRMESKKHEEKYEKKKDELEKEREEKKEQKSEETGMLGHKIQEIGHTVNASLKQNVGIGIGNYSSEVDKERAEEHQEKYEEKVEETKKKLEEKKEDVKEKINQGEMGIYSHKLQELGHNVNAKLKETIGLGIGDYSSEVDRKIAEEHREGYMEKVKEEGCTEVSDSRPIVHKLKEVAHVVNANLKELIGVGVGNYSSEIDRELIDIHHHKYEEKIHPNNTNQDEELSSSQDEDLKKKRKSEKKETKKFDKNEKKFDKKDEKKFDKDEKRSDKNEKKFDKGEKKLDKKDEKGFEKKFDKKDEKKFDEDEKRSDKNEKKFDKGEKKFDKKDEKGFEKNFDKKDEKKFEKDEERPATYEEVVENKF